MKITAYKTNIFKESQNLAAFINAHIPEVKEESVLAVSSKILALSLGLTQKIKTRKEFNALVKKESDYALQTAICHFTIKSGMVMTNAGIDESNAGGKIITLPKDAYKEAAKLRAELCKIYRVKNLGIIITDSMILPLRNGVIGAAVAYSGFKGVKSYKNKKDIYGRKLRMTSVDIADTLASSATLLMGEGNEKTPLAVIENAPVVFTNKTDAREIKYPLKKDLYYPFFKDVLK